MRQTTWTTGVFIMSQPYNKNEEGGGPLLTKVALIMLLCFFLSLIALPYVEASEPKGVSPEGWVVCAKLAYMAGYEDLANEHLDKAIPHLAGGGSAAVTLAYASGEITGWVYGMSMGSGKPVEKVAMEAYQLNCPPVI